VIQNLPWALALILLGLTLCAGIAAGIGIWEMRADRAVRRAERAAERADQLAAVAAQEEAALTYPEFEPGLQRLDADLAAGRQVCTDSRCLGYGMQHSPPHLYGPGSDAEPPEPAGDPDTLDPLAEAVRLVIRDTQDPRYWFPENQHRLALLSTGPGEPSPFEQAPARFQSWIAGGMHYVAEMVAREESERGRYLADMAAEIAEWDTWLASRPYELVSA
jgi:hypothetical protein